MSLSTLQVLNALICWRRDETTTGLASQVYSRRARGLEIQRFHQGKNLRSCRQENRYDYAKRDREGGEVTLTDRTDFRSRLVMSASLPPFIRPLPIGFGPACLNVGTQSRLQSIDLEICEQFVSNQPRMGWNGLARQPQCKNLMKPRLNPGQVFE